MSDKIKKEFELVVEQSQYDFNFSMKALVEKRYVPFNALESYFAEDINGNIVEQRFVQMFIRETTITGAK